MNVGMLAIWHEAHGNRKAEKITTMGEDERAWMVVIVVCMKPPQLLCTPEAMQQMSIGCAPLSGFQVPVHSLGRCDNNQPWPPGNPHKIEVFRK